MHILVTGGAGYIGSHTVLELMKQGYKVTIVDNLINSSAASIERVNKLAGHAAGLYIFDLQDKPKLQALFDDNSFDAVIHFAGLKAVGESVAEPLRYYQTNLQSTLVLCQVMKRSPTRQLVFSSSATVYGAPEDVPILETAPIHATNPYGQTKVMIEQILQNLAATNNGWQITALRYFNPVGADESGLIGEDPSGIPNNLLPFVAQVAIGRREKVAVYGNDYRTVDGTGVRDYIHVTDLSLGHIAALDHPPRINEMAVYNLGTGTGNSVLEAIHAFELAANKPIPYEIIGRRAGDIAECYADVTKVTYGLEWRAERSLPQACQDAWRWQSQNPNGYK